MLHIYKLLTLLISFVVFLVLEFNPSGLFKDLYNTLI